MPYTRLDLIRETIEHIWERGYDTVSVSSEWGRHLGPTHEMTIFGRQTSEKGWVELRVDFSKVTEIPYHAWYAMKCGLINQLVRQGFLRTLEAMYDEPW